MPFRHACGAAFLRLLAVLALVASGNSLFAATVTQSNITYTYTVGVPTAAVSGNTSASGAITIPSTITVEGATYNVTSIGIYALNSLTSLTSVTIPSSVTTLGTGVFTAAPG